MVANKHDFKLAVRDIIARFQLDVPLGHCAEKYVAEDDAVDAAIREVVLMRLTALFLYVGPHPPYL
jgi:hypothetical protein